MKRIHSRCTTAASLLLVVSFAVLGACYPTPGTSHCGDGVVSANEECDDDTPACEACRIVACGDGVEAGAEECDDGNNDNEDVCRNNCSLADCVDDADCLTAGEICLSTNCRPGCRNNADCNALPLPGEVCDRQTCEPKPTSDDDCGRDEVLDEATGACVKGCRIDEDCQFTSKLGNRICTKRIASVSPTELPCACASECTGNKICTGYCSNVVYISSIGVCQTGCREASQCAPGQFCNAYNQCADVCLTNADCCNVDAGNAGDTCVAGACTDGCAANADCGRGTICSASLCVAGCEINDDCDGGRVCTGNSCVLPAGDLCGDGNGSKCVFVTADNYSAILGGASGADASCQLAALNSVSASVQGGTFMAWISDSSTSPLARFTLSAVPYKLLDGTTIANNWADLTDGTLASEIDIDELGGARSSQAWTNTLPSGAADNVSMVPFFDSCSDWTDTLAETGLGGDAGSSTGSDWTQAGTLPCGSQQALYCFQQ